MQVGASWEDLELFSWVKDTKGRFIFCTENVAQIAGADSPSALSKKTDFDLVWRDRAKLYLKEEHVVLLGESVKVMQLQTTVSGTIEIVVTKYPLVNQNGKIIGTVGSSIDITQKFISNKSGYFDKKGNLHLGKPFNVYLTGREVTILRHILSGYGAKQIGKEIKRSFRTVDSHTESIKKKLQCRTKGDIVSVCIQFGLIYLCNYFCPTLNELR